MTLSTSTCKEENSAALAAAEFEARFNGEKYLELGAENRT